MLSVSYVEDHLVDVHTHESFGRSLVAMSLENAIQILGAGDLKEVEIDAKIRVIEVASKGCIKICVSIPFGKVCFHQKV